MELKLMGIQMGLKSTSNGSWNQAELSDLSKETKGKATVKMYVMNSSFMYNALEYVFHCIYVYFDCRDVFQAEVPI